MKKRKAPDLNALAEQGPSAVSPELRAAIKAELASTKEVEERLRDVDRLKNEVVDLHGQVAAASALVALGQRGDSREAEVRLENAERELDDERSALARATETLRHVRKHVDKARGPAKTKAVATLRSAHEAVVTDLDDALERVACLAMREREIIEVGSRALDDGSPGGRDRICRYLRPLSPPANIGDPDDPNSGFSRWRKEALEHGYKCGGVR